MTTSKAIRSLDTAPGSVGSLSARDMRARLSGTQPAADPTLVDVAVTTRDWRPGFRERLSDTLAPAAVLIPIVDRPDDLSVLLTRRSAKLKHHAGQVGFPGGRTEAGDADIVATALRETYEELGIHPHQVEVVGFLSPIPTLSGYAVTAVVGLLADDTRLTLDPTEVEAAFEVPLDYLLNPASQQHGSGDVDRVAFPIEFHFAGQRIWGVTASLLIVLRDALFPGLVDRVRAEAYDEPDGGAAAVRRWQESTARRDT